jgi:hypothetical protein
MLRVSFVPKERIMSAYYHGAILLSNEFMGKEILLSARSGRRNHSRERAEESPQPLDVRKGLSRQASVELEEPKEAAGTVTELPEPVLTLARRSVEAEAECDLDLRDATLAWRRRRAIRPGRDCLCSRRKRHDCPIPS